MSYDPDGEELGISGFISSHLPTQITQTRNDQGICLSSVLFAY